MVQIWNVESGKELSRTLSDGYQPVLAFAPDGDTLAISSGAGLVRLLDPKTGVERRRLFGRADQGARVVYSPSGKRLATAGADGTIQIWNAETGERVGSHEFPLGTASLSVRGIVFTADDRTVAWTSAGFTALAWLRFQSCGRGKHAEDRGREVGTDRDIRRPRQTAETGRCECLRTQARGEGQAETCGEGQAEIQGQSEAEAKSRSVIRVTFHDGSISLTSLAVPGRFTSRAMNGSPVGMELSPKPDRFASGKRTRNPQNTGDCQDCHIATHRSGNLCGH